MSPQHAKAFLRTLATNVERYEQEVGAIAMPPLAEGQGEPG
jgi:hypothetical protein